MRREVLAYLVVIALLAALMGVTVRVSAGISNVQLLASPTPGGELATAEELTLAEQEWQRSAHADTYDNGLGANTTCARCKSPTNWDPNKDVAQLYALDCASCKRVPGEDRPTLQEGEIVPRVQWNDIACEICHIPVGDTYEKNISFWNQGLGQYEPVESPTELCAHCHEGQHGFQVVEEQEATLIHKEMTCTECHGAHGAPSACEDCHDPLEGLGEPEHVRHPSVDCSACHDSWGLTIWQDPDPTSPFYSRYITRRFAHTLTSWPSHALTTEVNCQRCHHPRGDRNAAVVPYVPCNACHEEHPQGAVSVWCEFFERDREPLPTFEETN